MDISIPPQRQCGTCEKSFPATLEYFRAHKGGKYGLYSVCRSCVSLRNKNLLQADREQRRAYQQTNKERLAAYHKEYHQAHKDKWKTYCQTYRQSHKEQVLERGKEYYQTHKEQESVRGKKYYQTHKEQVLKRTGIYQRINIDQTRGYGRTYYHKQRAIDGGKRDRQYARIYRQTHFEWVRANNHRRRAYERNNGGTHVSADIQQQYKNQRGKCYYCKKKVGKTYHVDHVIPLSKGGSNGPENIVIACPRCNLRKNANIWRLL